MKRHLNPWLNAVICLGLIGCLVSISQVPRLISAFFRPVEQVAPITEVRGVWLTNVASSVLFSPWGIHRAIDQLANLHFNTLYPVVWNRGQTFYPSSIMHEMTGRSQNSLFSLMQGSDGLAEMVKYAHRRGFKVIPWFEYGLMIPANSALAKRHPDWLTVSQSQTVLSPQNLEADDSNQAKSGNPVAQWLKARRNQRMRQQAWLNPCHPQVKAFLIDLISEVITYYEVDGIQFDDHFGFPVAMGYDPYTVALYKKEHQGRKPPSNPQDSAWMRWRAAKLSQLMAEIVKTVRATQPHLKISLSPNTYHFAYQTSLQDWKNWVQRGWIDELILQVYRQDLDSFQRELSRPEVRFARQKIPVSIGILTGTLVHPVPSPTIVAQIEAVRDRGFAGFSLFYWESLWSYFTPESPHQRRQAFREILSVPKAS